MQGIDLNPQDFIDTLTKQRDAAMNEIVHMSAIIAALNRQLKEKKDGEAGQQ